jgi:signal transduction histidine kinase
VIDVKISGTPTRLPYAYEMNLLRIGQEALSNAVTHGHAQKIALEVTFEADSVKLTVSDDGEGFSPEDGVSSGHFGLLDMRERASSMGSELQIQSTPGRGTAVSVQVPLTASITTDGEAKANSYSRS